MQFTAFDVEVNGSTCVDSLTVTDGDGTTLLDETGIEACATNPLPAGASCDYGCGRVYDRVDGDLSMGFGGLHGRGAKKQDPPIERDLFLSLEEVFHGCTKKMKDLN